MAYVQTNVGHKGLKYKTRVDKGILLRETCACGSPRHRMRSGKLSNFCLLCKNKGENAWHKKNKERWAVHQFRSRLKRDYKLTLEEFYALLEFQEGKCDICKTDLTVGGGGTAKQINVDHNHDTGVVRGLLCSKCNWGIGNFREDPLLLTAAMGYLERHSKLWR